MLVVDDNAVNRKLLELLLHQLGIEWLSVADGRQAVDAWEKRPLDLILMDIQMPVMDGLEATREIRRRELASGRTPTPIIIVSANCAPEHVRAGLEAGADRHLAKPVDVAALVRAFEDLAAGSAARSATGAPRIKSGDGVGLDPGKPEAEREPA